METQAFILRLLTRKLGEVPVPLQSQIKTLSITELEDLGEALLSFETLTDLSNWFA